MQGVAAAPACAPAARLPARRGTSTGPQRPLAASGCPPRGGGGGAGERYPWAVPPPQLLPRPALPGAYAVPPQKVPAGTAAAGGGTGLGEAAHAYGPHRVLYRG